MASDKEYELKDLSQIELRDPGPNILDLSAVWMDDGTRIYFALGAANYILQLAKLGLTNTSAYNIFGNIFGGVWNFFDGIAGYLSAGSVMSKINATTLNVGEKVTWAALDVVMSTQLNIFTGFTMYSQFGIQSVFHAATALAFSPLGGLGFALCMWASMIKACVKLDTARRNLFEPEYYLLDRKKRYEEITAKIEKINKKETEKELDDKDKKILEKLIQKQTRFKTQIIAYSRAKFDEIKKNQTLLDFLSKPEINVCNISKESEEENNYKLNARTEADIQTDDLIFRNIVNEQRLRVAKNVISVTAWTLAALGMTLLAIAPIFPPALIFGMIISTIAGAVKLGEVLIPKAITFFAEREIKEEIIKDYEKIHQTDLSNHEANYNHNYDTELIKYADNLFSISEGNQLKLFFLHLTNSPDIPKIDIRYFMAYDLCKAYPADFLKNNNNINTISRDKFFEEINKMTYRARNIFLNNAQEKFLEDKLLERALKLENINNNDLLYGGSNGKKISDVKNIAHPKLVQKISALNLSDKDKKLAKESYLLAHSGFGIFDADKNKKSKAISDIKPDVESGLPKNYK